MINGYLSEQVKIAPFSVDTLSEGSFWLFHPAIVASSVKILKGLVSGDIGIFIFLKKSRNLLLVIRSRNFLLKGPTYDTKAEAKRTSPVMTISFSPRSTMA